MRPCTCDLGALAAEVVARFTVTLPEPGLALRLDAPADAIIRADPGRLEQALTNLIGNAIKYSPAGARSVLLWSLRARWCGCWCAIGGSPPEEQATIFEPFNRSSLAPPVASGIGIGLYITAQIVTGHGGTIAVESLPGQGSCFTVTLPVGGPPG